MTDHWITIEQAAVSLGLSVRTVNRHITAGKLQSRLHEGRREVLIGTPDATSATSGANATTSPNALLAGEHVSDPASVDYETVLALADNAADKADLAVSAYQTLARSANDRIHTTRRAAYVAWSLVGILTLGALGAVGWTSHALTRASVENEHLHEQAVVASQMAGTAADECDDLRRALADARDQAARAEGRLSAYMEPRPVPASAPMPVAIEPTTRPTLVDRLASIFD
jgi:hypothetical protein